MTLLTCTNEDEQESSDGDADDGGDVDADWRFPDLGLSPLVDDVIVSSLVLRVYRLLCGRQHPGKAEFKGSRPRCALAQRGFRVKS